MILWINEDFFLEIFSFFLSLFFSLIKKKKKKKKKNLFCQQKYSQFDLILPLNLLHESLEFFSFQNHTFLNHFQINKLNKRG